MGMKINNPLPFETYRDLRLSIRQLYIQLPRWITMLGAGNVEFPILQDMFTHMKNAKEQWAAQLAAADTVALRDFARSQHSDPAYDPAVEYSALVSAVNQAGSWLKTNVTTSSGIDQPPVVITPAESAQLVVLLQAVKAACE